MEGKGKKKTKCKSFCKTHPIFPVCVRFGSAIEVNGEKKRRLCWGSKVRGRGLCQGVPTGLNRIAAEQEHNIRRRTSMQLEETHILCAMTNKE